MTLRKRIKHFIGSPRMIKSICSRSSASFDENNIKIDAPPEYCCDLESFNDRYGGFHIVDSSTESFQHYVGIYSALFSDTLFPVSERISEISKCIGGNYDKSSITIVLTGRDDIESNIMCAQLRSLIYGWSCKLSAKGIVCNGVFVHSTKTPKNIIMDSFLFLSSRWGQVLNGEIIELGNRNQEAPAHTPPAGQGSGI